MYIEALAYCQCIETETTALVVPCYHLAASHTSPGSIRRCSQRRDFPWSNRDFALSYCRSGSGKTAAQRKQRTQFTELRETGSPTINYTITYIFQRRIMWLL